MLEVDESSTNTQALDFCKEFLASKSSNKYVFGINEYADCIASAIEITGFIDDFTPEISFLGKPIVKLQEVPKDALVVSSLLGRPFTAKKLLKDAGLKHIDFFSFYRYSGLQFKPVRFWSNFNEEFEANRERYNWVYEQLADEISMALYKNILNFRLTSKLGYISDFRENQRNQYFEPFLGLENDGEVFVDVGGFDGFTTEEFIRRCPDYEAAYVFEPQIDNMITAKERLSSYANIKFFQKGLSNEVGVVRFSAGGSVSNICDEGEVEILVDILDNLVDNRITFLKMDIEGAESLAIDGAKMIIEKYHPRLALCVYHKQNDLWKIPEQVFNIRDDYEIYLRHYTEGVVETVMFFMPKVKETK